MTQLDASNDVRALQPENIKYMLVTFVVSQLDTSKDIRESQLWNIAFIFVISDVIFKYSTVNKLLFFAKLQYVKSLSEFISTV